jgi:hypothetical protein
VYENRCWGEYLNLRLISDRHMKQSSTLRRVIISTGALEFKKTTWKQRGSCMERLKYSNKWWIIFKWISRKYHAKACTGFILGRDGKSGGPLWTRQWYVGLDKARGRPWQLLRSLISRWGILLHQTCYLERRARWQSNQWTIAKMRKTRDTSGSKWRELDRKYRSDTGN